MKLFNQQIIVNFKPKKQMEPFEYPQMLQGQIRSSLKSHKKAFSLQKVCSKAKFLEAKQQICFESLCKMLFPESNGQGISSIDINILDTIFYKNDGSLFYVYYDIKKGLMNLKNKNIYETFLKRSEQLQVKHSHINYNNVSGRSLNSKMKPNSYKFVIGSSRDCFAILKYKDDTIMRLKQTDFRAIFTNPLYANEKLRNLNNTKYIQIISNPQQQAQRNSTITIPFTSEDYKSDQLFQLALKITCDQGCFVGETRRSKIIKDKIKILSKQVYLYFLVFEIYSYVLIHYNKQIKRAIFKFVKLNSGQFSLASASQIILQSDYNVQVRFQKKLIFQQDDQLVNSKEYMDQIDQNFKETELQSSIINYFSLENKKLKQSVLEFVNAKFSKIKNVNDEKISNQIFRILNPNTDINFQTLIADDKQFLKFLNDKFAQNYFKDRNKFKQINGPKNQCKIRPKTGINRNDKDRGFLLKPFKLSGEKMSSKKRPKMNRQLIYSISRAKI